MTDKPQTLVEQIRALEPPNEFSEDTFDSGWFYALDVAAQLASRPSALADAAATTTPVVVGERAGDVRQADMSNHPKDGRMLCLLVDYSDGDHPLEDAKQAWTIGYNTLANTGDDEWLIAGWSWEQDCYTDGRGAVIGWLPFPCDPTPTPALGWRAMQTAAAEMLQAASAKCRENFTYPAKTKEQRDWQTGAIINSNAAAAIRTLPSPTDAQLLAEAVKLPEIAAMQDKIDGLASDLERAVEVAFRHGAVDWVRLNYPQQYAALTKIGEQP